MPEAFEVDPEDFRLREMTEPPTTTPPAGPEVEGLLRCVECGGSLRRLAPTSLECTECGAEFPIDRGTARMLPRQLRGAPAHAEDAETALKRGTAASFAYEWGAFGEPRPEWRRNFVDYMKPHPPEFFKDLDVLDVGAGSGRHAKEAARLGARVVAVDLGDSIDVARSNLPPDVITVQADAESLPFPESSFDFVMSIGVLHHLPDTARALRGLVRYVKPGGRLHVYLYWLPTRRSHRALLRVVSLARRLTTRLPHSLLHAICYPLAGALYGMVVLPYRLLRRFPGLSRLADAFPLKAYADYPFGVLVNDQFDRFSAPIERRFTKTEAQQLMHDAGLAEVLVLPNNGWVCDGRRPPAPGASTALSKGTPERPVADPDAAFRLCAIGAQSPMTPGFRIRVLLLRDELARYGVHIDPEPLFTSEEERRFREEPLLSRSRLVSSSRRRLMARLEERQHEIDAVLIQRQADMLPSLRLEKTACRGRRVIWDVDDAIWLDTAKEAREHPLAVLKGTRHKVRWLARRADHVIAGNHILAEWLSDYAERVTIVPSLVETRGVEPKRHSETSAITLVWIGSPPTARYLAPLRQLLPRLQRALPQVTFRLVLVGGSMETLRGIDVDCRDWSPEEERRALMDADIGLMPLPDAPWTRGKCSYKALQYMAAGLPAVADDVGVAAEVIGDGGIVVRNSAEWLEALMVLAEDAALRSAIGKAARERVEQEYSVAAWAPVVAGIVRGA